MELVIPFVCIGNSHSLSGVNTGCKTRQRGSSFEELGDFDSFSWVISPAKENTHNH